MAPSLQAAAKALDQPKKKDAISMGLAQRGTTEQSGVDTTVAAILQATARALEQARIRDAVSYQLQQRGTAAQAGIDQNIAPSLQSIAQQLEMKQKQLPMKQHLQARPDQQELLDQNVLYANAILEYEFGIGLGKNVFHNEICDGMINFFVVLFECVQLDHLNLF